jgi:hypothetical protein
MIIKDWFVQNTMKTLKKPINYRLKNSNHDVRKKIISINDDWVKITMKIFMSSRLLIETKIIVIMSSSFVTRLKKKKNRKTIFVVCFFRRFWFCKKRRKIEKQFSLFSSFQLCCFRLKKIKIKDQFLLIFLSIELRHRFRCRRYLSILSFDSLRNHLDRFFHQFLKILR